MKEFRFLYWNVYKDAKKVVHEVFKVYKILPTAHKYDLGSQMNRSAISIVLNIAEGSGKSSQKDLSRFFDIAIGSTYETLAAIDIAYEEKLISEETVEMISLLLINVAKQLGGFKKKIKELS